MKTVEKNQNAPYTPGLATAGAPAGQGGGLAPKKRGLSRSNRKEAACGTALAAIPVAGFIIFGLIPLALALIMAFLYVPGKGDIFSPKTEFVGFDNFAEVLGDPMFWQSIGNTMKMAISLPICIVIALLVAYLLTKNVKCRSLFRAIYFVPYVCCAVAVAMMWELIFNQNHGILNALLGLTRETAIPWLTDSNYYIWCLIVIGVWSGTAYGIVLFGAALTNISPALYEAASMDGANSFQSFLHITLPSVSPTTFYLLITGLIGALQEFTRSQIISGDGAGPNNDGLTIVFYVYRRAFVYNNQMGNAAAAALVLAVLITIVSAINFVVSKKWVSYD